jgi:hypothetical protein
MQDEMSSRTAGGLMAFQWGFGFKVRFLTKKNSLNLIASLAL